MRWLNCEKIRLVIIGFAAALILGGGSVEADFTWTQRADMPTPRWLHSACVVNGKIYIFGGATSDADWRALSTVEEYDPATDMWTRKADMPTARCPASAVVDGKIYVIGGWDGTGQDSSMMFEFTTKH